MGRWWKRHSSFPSLSLLLSWLLSFPNGIHLAKRPKPRDSFKNSSKYIYLHGTQLWWFLKQRCLTTPSCSLCSLPKQTMFSSLAISWNMSYPCFWLQPPWAADTFYSTFSDSWIAIFWVEKNFLASSTSSTVRILGYSQHSMDVTHRHLTGKERGVWSHISMSCTFELQSIESSLGYFLSCSREMSPDATQVNLHGWLCEQQSHHQIVCIDRQPIKCTGKRERSQNQRDLVEVQVNV